MCHKVEFFLLLFLWAFSLIKIKCVHSVTWYGLSSKNQCFLPLLLKLQRSSHGACVCGVHLCIWSFVTHVFWCLWNMFETSAPLQTICWLVFSLPVCLLENSRGCFFFFFFSSQHFPWGVGTEWGHLLLIHVLFLWLGVARTSEEDGFPEGQQNLKPLVPIQTWIMPSTKLYSETHDGQLFAYI